MNSLFTDAHTRNDPSSTASRIDSVANTEESETHKIASPPKQMNVHAIARLLAGNNSNETRGLLHVLGIIGAPLSGITLVYGLRQFFLNGEIDWIPAGLLGVLTLFILVRQTEMIDQARAALQNSQLDKRWLGALSEALEWPDRRVRNIASLLLKQFLPRLTEADSRLFTKEQRNCLYRRLSIRAARSDAELAMVILKALPVIGTEGAVPYVERLATIHAWTPIQRQVRKTASGILLLLEARVAQQHAAEDARQATLTDNGPCENQQEARTSFADAQMRQLEADLNKADSPAMRLGFLFASWFIIVPYATIQTVEQFTNGNWLGGVLFGLLTLLGTQLHRFTLTNRHKVFVQRLARLNDVRCIGRLAEALDWPDETVRTVVIPALTRLLPRLNASDRGLLNSRQRGNLHRMLVLANAERHGEFLISILRALEQIGDASAVPFVVHLATAQPTSAWERKVCDAASECLPYVKTSASLSKNSQTLLRASSATATGTDMLVRPASATDVVDQEQLLRAGPGGTRDSP